MSGFDVRDAARAMRRDSWVRPHLRTHWKMLAAAVLLSSLAFVFASALMFTSGYMIEPGGDHTVHRARVAPAFHLRSHIRRGEAGAAIP